MRFPPFAYPRAEMQARVIERLEAGMALRVLETQPGFPRRQTLHSWGKADPDFAVRLARARAWGKGVRVSATAGPVFDAALKWASRSGFRVRGRARRRTPALLASIVEHIQRGGSVRSAAMSVPGAPNVSNLREWLKADRAFAQDVARAKRMRDEILMDAVLELGRRATAESAAEDAVRFARMRERFGQLHGGRKARGSG